MPERLSIRGAKAKSIFEFLTASFAYLHDRLLVPGLNYGGETSVLKSCRVKTRRGRMDCAQKRRNCQRCGETLMGITGDARKVTKNFEFNKSVRYLDRRLRAIESV